MKQSHGFHKISWSTLQENLCKLDLCKSFEFKEPLLHSAHPSYLFCLFTVLQCCFFNDFSSLLERLVSSPGYLLVGDFNFHVNDPSDNTGNTFLDLLNCINLEVSNVCTPTCKSNNVLDLIIARSGEATVFNLSVNDPVISDHFAVRCNLAIKRPPKVKLKLTSRKLRTILQTIYGVTFAPLNIVAPSV